MKLERAYKEKEVEREVEREVLKDRKVKKSCNGSRPTIYNIYQRSKKMLKEEGE